MVSLRFMYCTFSYIACLLLPSLHHPNPHCFCHNHPSMFGPPTQKVAAGLSRCVCVSFFFILKCLSPQLFWYYTIFFCSLCLFWAAFRMHLTIFFLTKHIKCHLEKKKSHSIITPILLIVIISTVGNHNNNITTSYWLLEIRDLGYVLWVSCGLVVRETDL